MVFGGVNGGVGGAVENGVDVCCGFGDGGAVADVEFFASGGDGGPSSGFACFGDVLAEHAVPAGDEDPHGFTVAMAVVAGCGVLWWDRTLLCHANL